MPRGGKGRCGCAYSTLFAPAGRRRFRVGAPDFGVSRRKGVCGAVCPSRAVWQARREAENGATLPPFAACSREKREGRCGFRASSANRSSRAALFPRHPAGRTAGSARTRSRVQTLEDPFLGSGVCFPRLPSQKPPQADGPCSWAVRRVCALPPEQKRNEASPPPAHGADLRDQRAEGTGRPHCRPPVTSVSPSPQPPQAASPCSWTCRRLHARPPHQKRNEAPKPPARGAWVRVHAAEGTGRRHCRLTCRRRSWRRWRR